MVWKEINRRQTITFPSIYFVQAVTEEQFACMSVMSYSFRHHLKNEENIKKYYYTNVFQRYLFSSIASTKDKSSIIIHLIWINSYLRPSQNICISLHQKKLYVKATLLQFQSLLGCSNADIVTLTHSWKTSFYFLLHCTLKDSKTTWSSEVKFEFWK